MKNLIWGILTLSIIFAATTALAVDDATVQAIEEKASSANSKADGNNSRIQALEAEDVVIKEKVNMHQILKADKTEVEAVMEMTEAVDAKTAENKIKVDNVIIKADANKVEIEKLAPMAAATEEKAAANKVEIEKLAPMAAANKDKIEKMAAEKATKAELKKLKDDLCSLYELTGQPLPLSCLVQSVTLEYEDDALDLESGQIRNCFNDPFSCFPEPPFDLQFAFNAQRSNPTVLFQTQLCGSFSAEIAFLDGTIFSSVTAEDIPNLSFTTGQIDVPFDPDDTIVLLTCDGNYFKIGDAICNAYDPNIYPDCSDPSTPIGTVTINYQLLE